jgi:tetratricopeptide (TPR) repeat protein
VKLREDLKWILPLVAACLVVFANTLGGDFVYDDTRQIVRNVLIQDNSLIWKALASDVWAFKGDGSLAASNYWRPTFTLWNIICFRLFGMDPVGWHVANILLHTGVCVLAYCLLRRWAFSAAIAFTIALIFAVHPVHVESVAWIAGSPDLLFALFFLGSLWFATSYKGSRSGKNLALMSVFYAAALGAKEIGIICLPIYYFVLTDKNDGTKSKAGANNTPLLMLGTIAVIYFLIRWAILGAVSRPPDDPTPLANAILSVWSMFVFYLRQVFGPFWLGANYPLEPVTQIGLTNFIIPLAITVAALAAIWYLAKTSKHGWLAASLFLLPLVPAMNASLFPAEQLVHDRYLYLPLLGILMLLVPFAARWLSERNIVIAGVIYSALLSIQTIRYNSAWASELALWSWTRGVDDSSFTSMQLGSSLADAGRNDESIKAYSAAIAKRPKFRALLGRARGYLALKQYANAEKDLAAAFALPVDREAYALYQAYEALGIAYSEQRKYDEAIRRLRDARSELPIYSAALTEKLAVVLYQAGRKDEALRELEGVKTRARSELLPESKSVFFRLGMLYAELGRKDEARANLREFIDLTASVKDAYTIETRNQAARMLRDLK